MANAYQVIWEDRAGVHSCRDLVTPNEIVRRSAEAV